MRIVLQRVTRASVTVDGEAVSSIGDGLCLLVGIALHDGPNEVTAAVHKIAGLRVFGDDEGKLNRSVRDIGGEVLVVSQFTLLGDVRKGRRPSFTNAAGPAHAEPLVEAMVEAFERAEIGTQTGVFGATMEVDLVNDGPVTLVLDIRDGRVTPTYAGEH